MRYIIIHKTNPRWEAGALPSVALITRVGAMVTEAKQSGILVGGEGLRATSQGVRLRSVGGRVTVTPGPYAGGNELAAEFTIVRTASLDEAVELATAHAAVLGDLEIDIRPVTEPWDIGLGHPPERPTSRRYMVLRKADEATERGDAPTPAQRARLEEIRQAATRTGSHVTSVALAPSRRGRRYRNTAEGVRFVDGPFAESKELIAGYLMIAVESPEEADRWARRYLRDVEAEEVDLREVEAVV